MRSVERDSANDEKNDCGNDSANDSANTSLIHERKQSLTHES